MVVITAGIERQVDDGNVIDLDRFDHPVPDNRRDDVLIHGDLVVDFYQGIFTVLAHIKPNRHDSHILPRHGVDVFHTVDLPQKPFQGGGHELFNFTGTGSGGADINISQGYDDLRVFFPGRDKNRGNSH